MSLKMLVKRALGRGSESNSGNGTIEQPAAFYDDAYANIDEYKLPYFQSCYYFVWTVIVDRVLQLRAKRILEIGCGPGQLGQFLIDQGIESYVGLDFSATGLELARQNVPAGKFVQDDARTSSVYQSEKYDAIICTEVLEHIEADLEVVSKFPPGTPCICSVPSFPYRSHVRHFLSAAEVTNRYQPYFRDFSVFTIRMPKRGGEDRYYLFQGVRNEVGCVKLAPEKR